MYSFLGKLSLKELYKVNSQCNVALLLADHTFQYGLTCLLSYVTENQKYIEFSSKFEQVRASEDTFDLIQITVCEVCFRQKTRDCNSLLDRQSLGNRIC